MPKPGNLPPELLAGRRLWNEHRYDEALAKLAEAVRKAPRDVQVLVETARALALRFQADRSVKLLERAIAAAPRRAAVHHAVGETYKLLRRPQEAEASFRRAASLDGSAASLLELARLVERRHALDEALALVEKALHATPGATRVLVLQGRIERRRGEYDKARTTLARATSHGEKDLSALAEAFGELAALLDETGEYDNAWAAIEQAKRLAAAGSQRALATSEFVLNRCRQMMRELSAEHLRRWSAPREDDTARVALLAGFPRTGTTLLEQVLDAHPDVVRVEEAPVFSEFIFPWLGEGRPPDAAIVEMLDGLAPSKLAAARGKYLGALESALGEPFAGRMLLDKNPAMTLMIPAMRRIFPELKVIVALRDPRDVVLSCYLRHLPVNPVSVSFLTLERTADRYVLDMGAWLEMREMLSDWIEVRYEAMVADLPGTARGVLAGLGLAWDEGVLEYRERLKANPVQSPTYEAVAKPIYTSARGRWRNYERQLAPVLDRLAAVGRALGYEF